MNDLNTLIDDIANQADELLEGCANPAEAQSLILEHLAATRPAIPVSDRRKITAQVIALLQNEGFFESAASGDSWATDPEDDDGQHGE